MKTDWTRRIGVTQAEGKGEDTDTGDQQAVGGRSNMFGGGGLLDTVYG